MTDLEEMMRKPLLYEVPGMDDVWVTRDLGFKVVEEGQLELDVYRPTASDGSLPAVILIAGDGPWDILKRIKDSGQYTGYGRILAASGFAAITFNHRSPWPGANFADVASDVDDAIEYVRRHAADLRIDPERLCIWAFSGGPPFGLRTVLRDTPAFVRCIVVFYGVMDFRHVSESMTSLSQESVDEFSPTYHLNRDAARFPPMFVAKAGRDRPWLNQSIDNFVAEALARNLTLDLMTHPEGEHAFDLLNDDQRSREIIRRTLAFIEELLHA